MKVEMVHVCLRAAACRIRAGRSVPRVDLQYAAVIDYLDREASGINTSPASVAGGGKRWRDQ